MQLIHSIKKPVALLLIPLMLNACAAYRLTDKKPQYLVAKSHEATRGVCAVAPFTFAPTDASDQKMMSAADLDQWNEIFFSAVNIADICARTIKVRSLREVPHETAYLIDGKVTEFYFKKNWVPMFFPGWMALTFFTLGVYGIAAGPTTSTKVDFGFTTTLRQHRSGKTLATIPEQFQSTDVMTIYSDENLNPYQNPGLAFEPTLNSVTKKLGEAISKAESTAELPPHSDSSATAQVEASHPVPTP